MFNPIPTLHTLVKHVKTLPGTIRAHAPHKKSLLNAFLILALAIAAVFTAAKPAATVFNASARKLPIYCVETDKKQISISFDAAWGADDTVLLLNILAQYDIRATFFLCGYWVDKYPDKVKAIYNAGHDIGNHGNTHAHGAQLDFEQNRREIQGAHDKVKSLLGIDMNLFRPPFGEYNNIVIEAAESLRYFTIQWDIDSLDWQNHGVEHEVNQVLNHKHLGNGSIILFHNDADFTPEALPQILDGLKAKGYEIVPISELILKENYMMDHEGRQKPKR